ncbi:deubiquitinase OTUD6B [Planococcus citri]|uniref:deubiquitinase OTUD6B n=1 Tax=Planococcus citri TaxID=170843 RepID=UPI0031F852CE
MENNAEEDYEELLQRHRKEKKELQGKLQALKKSASKGDKKRKKEVTEEIARLEAETIKRQEDEIAAFKSKNDMDDKSQNGDDISEDMENLAINGASQSQRISKAQKRRNRKTTQLKDRELRILEQDQTNLNGARHLETEEIKRLLKEKGLMICEIPSDGNCLYNAIIHRVKELDGKSPTLLELRSSTASFLRENRVDFLPYLSHPDTGNMLTESQYSEYCDQVADTTAWGGEIELRALSHVLKRPIEVIQAKGPAVVVGNEYESNGSSAVTLTYHRHMYGLGEHYNSVTQFKDENEDEFS